MKLSDLVNLRNELNALSSRPSKENTDRKLNEVAYLINNQPEIFGQAGQELLSKQSTIIQSFDNYEQGLDQLKNQINEQIVTNEKSWFQESYKLYESLPFITESPEYIFNRKLTISEDEASLFKFRIMKYSDWHHAAMIIRPSKEIFINDMVAFDPLYLIDDNYELLEPALNMFNNVYKERLRTYVINEHRDPDILEKLPNVQFGMCLAYNYFNYRPLEIIKKYLIEIYQKLKPGGILVMTFNDCDRPSAVRLVESKFCSYTPGYLVRELAISLGYEIEFSHNSQGPSTWIEFKKPGILTSIKGGQAITVIKHIDNLELDVDFQARKVYTIDEVEKMRSEATNLKADKLIIQSMKPVELKKFLEQLRYQHNQKIEQERLKEIRRQEKAEKQRIKDLHNYARSLDIDPKNFANKELLEAELALTVDRKKKEELVLLRQQAMQLQVGDPNLIRYGYSAEKLKQLIKEKEEGQK